MIKKIILLFLAVLACVFAYKFFFCSSCEATGSTDSLSIGISPEYPGFCEEDKDGNFIGREVNIVNYASHLLQKKPNYKKVDFLTLVQRFDEYKVSIGCLSINEERAKKVDFSDSYETVQLGYIIPNSKKMKNIKKVGFQGGTMVQAHIDAKYEGKSFSDISSMLEKLNKGELDAVATDKILFDSPLVDKSKYIFIPLNKTEKLAVAIKKGNKDIVEAVNRSIKKTDGGKIPHKEHKDNKS